MAYTYNPKQVKVIVTKGIKRYTIHGYAEDTFIEVNPKGEGTQSQTGCDGETQRSIDVNRQATIRLILQQGSDSNDVLSNLYRADRNSSDGAFQLSITEGGGKSILTTGTEGAWVQNVAPIQRGKNAGNREWTLETEGVDF